MKFIPAVLAAVLSVSFIPSVRAQDDDPKRAAAAEELLKAIHADQAVDFQKALIKKTLDAKLPKNLPPDVLKQAQDKLDTGLDAIFKQWTWDSIKPEFVRIYSHTFTESELKQLTAFYNSPIGRKYVEKKQEIDSDVMAVMQKKVQELAPQIASLIKDTVQFIKDTQNSQGGAPASPLPPAPDSHDTGPNPPPK